MIPFCQTNLSEEEKKALADVIDSGWVVLGKKSEEFEQKFAEYVGAKYSVFVDSGTSALFLALQFLRKDLKEAPRLLVPSLTFTATAEAALHAGYPIQFSEVNKETFCLDTIDNWSLPVHLLGNRAGEGAFIYDSAHRIEKDDVKGSMALWCYSFYATKNMTTGQGGMIATNSKAASDWLRLARDHGLDLGTKERYQGKYKQYDVSFVGWRVKGDDLRAVIGLEQLKKLPAMTERRNEIVARYNSKLGFRRAGNHVYPIFVSNREEFMQYMFDNGVQTTVHFRPLHLMSGYSKWTRSLPITEYIGERIVSLPLYPNLKDKEIDFISKLVKGSNYFIHE